MIDLETIRCAKLYP